MTAIWLWGVVASSLFAVPTSLYVLYDINKNDKDFKEYLKNRGSLKNAWLFIKSIAKILIPFVNIGYMFSMISKLGGYGLKGMRGFWKNRIVTRDNNLKRIKDNYAKIFKKDDKNETNTKSNTTQVTKNVTVNNQPKQVNNTQPNNKVTNNTTVNNIQPKVTAKNSFTLDAFNSPYSILINKLDTYNNSNISTDVLSKLYRQEYWNLRQAFDKETNQNKKTDLYNRICIIHNKYSELSQIRNNNKVLIRK